MKMHHSAQCLIMTKSSGKAEYKARGVQLLHCCNRGFKMCDKPKLKALLNWEIFAKHDQLSLSDISLELFLIKVVFTKQLTEFSCTVH